MRSAVATLVALALAVAVAGCGASAPQIRTATKRATLVAATQAVAPTPPVATTGAVGTTPTAAPTSPVTAGTRAVAAAVAQPRILWDPVPFGAKRKREMMAYVHRHYGSFMKPTWRLVNPHVIVIHYTDASYSSTYNTFATDVPDSELHELPATSAHFVIDSNGAIHQLVSLGTMARHTVGLNWTAIGIEHVGFSDSQVLSDHAQITASLHLVHWLRCRYHVEIRNVIGHAESLSSPFHHEDVPSLRTQTHGDFVRADMNVYRRRLRALGGC